MGVNSSIITALWYWGSLNRGAFIWSSIIQRGVGFWDSWFAFFFSLKICYFNIVLLSVWIYVIMLFFRLNIRYFNFISRQRFHTILSRLNKCHKTDQKINICLFFIYFMTWEGGFGRAKSPNINICYGIRLWCTDYFYDMQTRYIAHKSLEGLFWLFIMNILKYLVISF